MARCPHRADDRRQRDLTCRTASLLPTATTSAPIDLALQGGGSHGAFTWGVLDALLEDGHAGL
jgi:predicted acylesterase/phospholipase RssA